MSRYYNIQRLIPRGYTNLIKSTVSAEPKFPPFNRSWATQAGEGTLYDILKVQSTATEEEIKSAFYRLSKLYHPDVNSSKDAKKLWQDLNDAYNILINERTRKLYDGGMLEPGGEIRIPRSEIIFPVYEKEENPLAKKKQNRISEQHDRRQAEILLRIREIDERNREAYHISKIHRERMQQLGRAEEVESKSVHIIILISCFLMAVVGHLLYKRSKDKPSRKGKSKSPQKETSTNASDLNSPVIKTDRV